MCGLSPLHECVELHIHVPPLALTHSLTLRAPPLRPLSTRIPSIPSPLPSQSSNLQASTVQAFGQRLLFLVVCTVGLVIYFS